MRKGDEAMTADECCPRFDPGPWDGAEFQWEGKGFVKGRVSAFFHMPLNFGKVMRGLDRRIAEAGAQAGQPMSLSGNSSRWGMDLYVAVDGEVPGAENLTLSGRFVSKAYEGPYDEVGAWLKDFQRFAEDKGLTLDEVYTWFTTCPGCAKLHGENHVVIIGRLA